jgi:cytoplasmic tRNA 2-thiolation protein 2
LKKCLKCDNESKVVTRINEAMCKSCFNEYFTHKFRLTVSKMRFDLGDIVLFPYSGSQSSAAMLSLLSQVIFILIFN